MKKLSKKILMVLLALMLVVATLSVTAFASSAPETAKPGSGKVSGAVTGAQFLATKDAQGNIQLTGEVTLSTNIPINDGGTVTVDLNGNKINRSNGSTVFYVTNGTLTVKGAGEVTSSGVGSIVAADGNGVKVNFEDVTFTASSTNTNAMINADNKAQVTINGGKIINPNIDGNAIAAASGANVKVTGTEIGTKNGCALYANGEGSEITATNVTVKSESEKETVAAVGLENSGKIVLSGSTSITAKSGYAVSVGVYETCLSPATLEINDDVTMTKTTEKGVAVVVGKSSKMTMNGGTITAEGKALQVQEKATVDLKGGMIERTAAQIEDAGEPAVIVISGSQFNMESGTIKGAEIGIQVQDTNSKATVTGGTIESTDEDGAAAVAVTNGSQFEMTAGTIKSAGQGLSVGQTKDPNDEAAASATVKGNAKIICDEKSGFGEVQVGDNGTLTIEGDATITGSIAVFNEGKLNVKSGTISSKKGFAISTNGSKSTEAQITITGGTITGADTACGVYLPAGTLTVSGDNTSITGGAGIVARGGKLTVEGGKITATATGNIAVGDANVNGEPIQLPPAAVVMDNADYPGEKDAKTEIKDGEFKAASGDAVVRTEKGEKKTEGATNNNTKLDVKGGYFSQPVEAAYLDDTVKAEAHSSDGYSYHNSTAAAEKAGTLTGRPIANADKTADIVAAGLMTEKNDDFLNGLAKLVKASGTWATPVADSVDNTFYVVFKAATEDKTSGATYCLEFICNGQTYKTESISNVTEGGIFYFTPTMAGLTAEDFQGDFTINLYKDSVSPDNLVTTYKDTVYRVDYVASTGVKGEKKHIYVDAAHLEEALNNTPGSFTLLPDVNKWTYGLEKSKDGLAYTVKIGGVYASPIDPGHECPTKGFKDMTIYDTGKLWYHEAMDYMVLNGYIQGFPGNTLQPDGIATRAQLWVIMAQVKGVDVKSNPWYEAARKWAEENKYSDGLRPNDPIQREEIVKILWSIAGQPKPTKSLSDYKFGDAASVNDWAKTAMAWAIENGIMAGRGSNLVPQGIATRAELARFIYSYVTLMK